MYFEPAKKTYYRFPSSTSINNLDSRYYFPEKPHATGENIRYDVNTSDYEINRSNHYLS